MGQEPRKRRSQGFSGGQPPPTLEAAAQAEFRAKAPALAPKYRTELLEHALRPIARDHQCRPSMQLRVLRFGLPVDWDVRIGIMATWSAFEVLVEICS